MGHVKDTYHGSREREEKTVVLTITSLLVVKGSENKLTFVCPKDSMVQDE